ncbi:MAG: M1 family metallopeptidase [Chloroflexota bacterium]
MRHRKFHVLVILVLITISCVQVLPHTPTPTVEPLTETAAVPPTTPPIEAEAGAPGLGDSLYPSFGNGGYDVQHYTLDLTVNNVKTSDLDGITIIEAKATGNLSSFNLDFIGFEITSVTVNAEPADFERQEQELIITPSMPLAENESFTVEVQYEGSPEEMNSVALPVQTGWINFDKGSFVMSEPDGAASFYPVNDHPLDKATYTFRVTVPKPFEVAANGALKESTDNGDTTTYVFAARDPMASYLATINIGDFDTETMESASGVLIRNYYETGLPEDVNKPFARQGEMLDYFSQIFGSYPFEIYGSLVLNVEAGTALENQTLSVYGSDMIDPQNVQETELTVAHELSHQWFGDSVSVADWGDIWLNESFATYSEGLWIEHTEGRAALDDWIKDVYGFIRENHQDFSPPGEPPADDLFNAGVYYWGALGLHALRLEAGDEAFFEILSTYYERYEGGNARTADFIAVAEEVTGKDLEAFFEGWLYSEALAPIPALGLQSQ